MENNKIYDSNANTELLKHFVVKFEIEPYFENPTCDSSLNYVVQRILPLSIYYDKICNYINIALRKESGIVAKDFASGLKVILREYISVVSQLEGEYLGNNLDLQKLWYLLQSPLKILENLQK